MSILNRDSVLILGAGVSAPFGISLGGDMIGTIQKGIEADRDFVDGKDGRFTHELARYVCSTFENNDGFWKHPFFGSVLQRNQIDDQNLNVDGINSDLTDLRKLTELLSNQTSETIDDFIVENPSFSNILKASIAVEIMESSYEYDKQHYKGIVPIDFSTRTVGPKKQRNWIHLLINLVRQGLRTGALSSDHKVKIISFNYDGILEDVLEKQFSNSESEYQKYTEHIEIVHPHGLCGELNRKKIVSPKTIYEWAQNISVVNESAELPSHILEARQKAKDWIESSNQVYAAGFAFSAPNCDMLGMRSKGKSTSKYLHYCNYDGNAGVTLAAERCKHFKYIHPTNGTRDNPVSVEDWFYGGYLGEFSA